MPKPLVSIIIATYRRDISLKNALLSVVNQTYRNIEIIIVDDNDDYYWNSHVVSIINDIVATNCNMHIMYIKNSPNKGSALSRNTGISAATGEYITFLDDDDIYLPNKVNNQLSAMLEVNADYSITDLALYNENGSVSEIRKRNYLIGPDNGALLLYHLKYHMTGTDTIMFKKKYLSAIGGFEPIDVGDEYYLMMKAIVTNGKFVYVPVCDVKAYVHTRESGLSSGEGKINGENRLYQYKKTFFYKLEEKDIKYINMRHHAVLAFAYMRMKKYLCFFKEVFSSFVADPIDCIYLLLDRRKRQ